MAKLIHGFQNLTHETAYNVYTYGSKTRREIYSFGIRGNWWENTF